MGKDYSLNPLRKCEFYDILKGNIWKGEKRLNNIILYSTHCPKCMILEKKLNEKGINYKLVEDQELMIKKGFMSAPMLEVDGQVMDYGQAIKWVNEK